MPRCIVEVGARCSGSCLPQAGMLWAALAAIQLPPCLKGGVAQGLLSSVRQLAVGQCMPFARACQSLPFYLHYCIRI